MTSAQVSPVVAMAAGQKQIGLLASVQRPDKSQQEKTGMTGPCVTGTSQVTPSTIGGHLAEVCAVQGPPRHLTSNSPSPSPSSTASSLSPRPSPVNSNTNNIINSFAHQELIAGAGGNPRLTQSPATTNCTTSNASSYCNTVVGDGQQQASPPQQRPAQSPAHITISTSINVANSSSVSQASPNAAGPIVLASTTVRQLSSVDHQIRVLTPSEIMRTLPSLSQEHYDPPPTAIIHTVPVQSPAMVSHLSLCL